MRAFVVLILLLAGSSTVTAQNLAPSKSVFGLDIGSPLRLPACKTLNLGGGSEPMYAASQPHTCIRSNGAGRPYAVEFPWAEKPDAAHSTIVGIRLDDGTLTVVVVSTPGESKQRSVFSELQKKYGKPTVFAPIEEQNSFGAKFENIIASWKFDDLEVIFVGMIGQIDEGLLLIGTPQGLAARDADMKAHSSGRRPL